MRSGRRAISGWLAIREDISAGLPGELESAEDTSVFGAGSTFDAPLKTKVTLPPKAKGAKEGRIGAKKE